MSRFDKLLAELDLAKALPLDTAEDDRRIEAAADEGDDGDELHPSDAAILKVLRQMAAVVRAQGRAITALRAQLGAGGSGEPLKKALRLSNGRLDGEEFMERALSAQRAGRITAVDVSVAEAHINAGMEPPNQLVLAVLGEG